MMIETSPGSQLLALLESGAEHVVLVAPFIKVGALERVLGALDGSVTRVDCVTRWHPADIADGVCDLQIFDQLNDLPNGTLWIRHDLHAKYFRVDEACLMGSANLTGRALGWRVPSNLELMVDLPKSHAGLASWEKWLFDNSLPATIEMRERVAAQANELIKSKTPRAAPDVEAEKDTDERWLPHCARPDLLYGVYTGQRTDAHMVTSAFEYARNDLSVLGVPPDLPEPIFNAHIVRSLTQLDVIRDVMAATLRGVPDRNAPEIIGVYYDPGHEIPIETVWSTLKLWMIHFFPDEFRIETDQEVLIRGRQY